MPPIDSNSDLTLVIGHLDRQLRISEEAHGEEEEDGEKAAIKIKSLAQPQSPPPPASSSSSQAIAIDAPQLLETAQPTNKGASFPNRSLSSSASSINDDLHPTGGGAGSGAVPRAAAAAASGRGACVLERAALEIVESEGSYVMDLQQVIEGYLHDWKERACLKLDELETLFMNIEQLYAVNRHLNERLKETLGNVQLIAKCFLDLRDEFIVYTTYWWESFELNLLDDPLTTLSFPQYPLPRCHSPADPAAPVDAHQLVAGVDAKGSEPHAAVGILLVEARAEDTQVPPIIRRTC